jgi:hypothetical protein
MHPVVRVKACPNYASRSVFHYSRSPLYLLVWISRLTSLWIYSQRERSDSKFTFLALALEDCHFSPGVVIVAVGVDCVGFTTVLSNCGMLCVSMVGAIFCLGAAAFSLFLLPTGRLKATCRSNMSSSDSLSSSMLIYYTGSIVGICTRLGGGAAGVGAIYIVGIGGVADADICSYRIARAHLDKPSTSSTNFRRFL